MKKFFILFCIFISFQTYSHEIKPAIVDIIISDGSVTIELVINAETILAEVDASTYQDTNKSMAYRLGGQMPVTATNGSEFGAFPFSPPSAHPA